MLIAILIYFLREPESWLHPQLWAEDGALFYPEARSLGFLSLLRPYAGYLHFFPRVVALFSVVLPAAMVPVWFAYVSIVIVIAAAQKIAAARWEFSLSSLFPLALVAVPHFGEVFVTLTNVQWLTAPVLVMLACQARPQSKWQWLSDLSWLFAAGLSGPFILVAWPLFFRRYLQQPADVYQRVLLILATTCSVVQGVCLVAASPVTTASGLGDSLMLWVIAISERILDGLLTGQTLAPRLPFGVPEMLAMFIVLASAASLWYLRDRWSPSNRFAVSQFLLFGILVQLFTYVKFGAVTRDLLGGVAGDRYFVIPRILLLWVILAVWDFGPRFRYVVAGSLACVGFAAISTTLHRERWGPDDWASHAAAIDSGQPVTVHVNPKMTVELNR